MQAYSFLLINKFIYNFSVGEKTMIYSPDMTLREARALYFRLNHFADDGGYQDRWIKVKVWHLPIWLPNTEGRRRAVKLHDIHHVLTEYPTTWRGEAEISSWEIGAGGLRRYYAGWWLDIMNVAQGLVVNPRGVYRGFVRGRRSTNLYSGEFTEELLTHRVGEYRHKLGLDIPEKDPEMADSFLFAVWVLISIAVYAGSLSLVLLPVLLPLSLIGMWVFSG